MLKHLAAACVSVLFATSGAQAQDQVVNLYSARHYSTDEALYSNFTKATGIKINRVDSDDAGILARLKAEGSASPADVILLVDAARLYRGEVDGLFQPIRSTALEDAIPANLRAKPAADGGIAWFGFSTRARIVVYDKIKVKREDVDTYEKLADPRNKGKICIRSGSHPYNLSLFGAITEHLGEAKAEEWLRGLKDNLARSPKGGDTDQIKGAASGECQIAVTNSYYFARMMRGSPEDRAVTERLGVVFPNQASWGTHLNIAGGAVARHAKNQANAVKFLEYLASASAQNYFANGNNEWPTAKGVVTDNAALKAMAGGKPFKSETIPISAVGANVTRVQQMLDRVGFP
jgi:iron(III) transport system substrate-binding protein